MFLSLNFQILNIYHPIFHLHWYNLHTSQIRTSWIGTMSAFRDQTQFSPILANRSKIFVNGDQARILACCTTVGLEGDLIKLCNVF